MTTGSSAADETTAAGRMTVGFVGLGNMGLPMARRLAAAGHRVRGFDAAGPARAAFAALGDGAGVAGELTSVGDGASAVILMLPDSDVVEAVLLAGGLLARLAPGTTVIDMSSSDPARTRLLAAKVAAAGLTLIDAPVSGGVAGATAGTLTVMVGGPAASFARFRPLLAAVGSRVLHAGEVGAGHAVKALNNLLSASHLLASSQALVAGQRFGLDPAVMLEIINGSSGRSGSTETKLPEYVLTRRYDDPFSMRLMVKDIRLALAIEQSAGVPTGESEAVVAAWETALSELPPGAAHTAIARWVDERG